LKKIILQKQRKKTKKTKKGKVSQKKRGKTLSITVVIHSILYVREQLIPHTV
jgi:hypothetical protein